MLDLMGLGPEAVVVIHVGGAYGDIPASRQRWVDTWLTLPEPVRRRLVLEHDDLRFSAADVLWIHEKTGVRIIFDHQHFWCLNPEKADLVETFAKVMATWPSGQQPKIHFSSPRTEMREKVLIDKATKKKLVKPVAPVFTGHADFCNPFEFATFMRQVAGFDFDVMLEAKAKDLALVHLRPDLLRYAPDVAERFGIYPEEMSELSDEERSAMDEDDTRR
jgi:UV DNA damage endonuclease